MFPEPGAELTEDELLACDLLFELLTAEERPATVIVLAGPGGRAPSPRHSADRAFLATG